ncbi:glutamate receptor ionotropic, kainate 4-like isoform X2 [Homarus americanus]|uniref:glutamate receptor ionotropic, kainate 4-like isoform X2 n=1 Tax=Homarus americanus TaxID=6706 RepID=UPI001C475B8F|nr:glutamate receptor ionotropic, kainate 4-like isoform X2 [Homarus americanus]
MNTAATVTAAVAIVTIGMTADATNMTAGATNMTAGATNMTAGATNSSSCLKVCDMIYFPRLSLDDTTRPYTIHGPMYEVLKILTSKLNTCFEWVFPDLVTAGFQQPNGTWLGVISYLIRQECDISGSSFPMNHLRFHTVDFSIPIFMESSVIAYQSPVIGADLAGFVKPFTTFIWLLILASMVAVVVGIFFIEWGESFLLRPQQSDGWESYGSVGPLTVAWTSCLWTLGAAVAQSSTWSPQRDSVRLLSGLWLLISVILSLVYRCNLKAMLIMPKVQVPFNSLEELMETDIHVVLPKGTLIHEFVTVAPPGSLLHQVNERIVLHTSPPRAMKEGSAGLYAVIATDYVLQSLFHDLFSMTNSCPMYIASEPVFTGVPSGLAFTKGSPLKHAVDPILRRLLEFGIVQHLYDAATRNGTVCFKPESFTRPKNSLRPLELEDFYGVFAVYAGEPATKDS